MGHHESLVPAICSMHSLSVSDSSFDNGVEKATWYLGNSAGVVLIVLEDDPSVPSTAGDDT